MSVNPETIIRLTSVNSENIVFQTAKLLSIVSLLSVKRYIEQVRKLFLVVSSLAVYKLLTFKMKCSLRTKKTLLIEGNAFVCLIWIASSTALINIYLLLHFETETTGCIEMHRCTHIETNPIYCSFWGDIFVFTLAKVNLSSYLCRGETYRCYCYAFKRWIVNIKAKRSE